MQNHSSNIEGIDRDVQLAFREKHIKIVLPYLKKAGIEDEIITRIATSYTSTNQIIPYEKWFLKYGQQLINEALAQNLTQYQTVSFNSLLRVALKDLLKNDLVISSFRRMQELI